MGFKELASEHLGISIEEITMDLSPQNNPLWTSLKQIKLIQAVEKEYGIKFSFKEMKKLKNMKLFVDALKDKGIEVNISE